VGAIYDKIIIITINLICLDIERKNDRTGQSPVNLKTSHDLSFKISNFKNEIET
jgi:hypothetical protein